MKRPRPRLVLLATLFVLTATAAWADGAKVQVCHVPPGNPGNFHTITISENALPAHLGHGDLPGACFAHCDTLCSDNNPCTIDACDASEHCLTTHPPVDCNDGNPCTIDSCHEATGCVSTAKTCMDSSLCTVDACDPLTGSCVFPAVTCSAGQACNPATGACQGVDACAGVTCPPPDQCHLQGVCSGGVCGNPAKPDGTPCDDGNPFTLASLCFNGVCLTQVQY
jgi:hypothetical protein